MRTNLITVLLLTLCACGCTSPGAARAKAIHVAAAPQIQTKTDHLNLELTAAKKHVAAVNAALPVGGPAPPADDRTMQSRIDTYGVLQKEKDELDSNFAVAFDANQQTANNIAKWKTGIGLAGLASGIGAAALTAASPANAVWVVVFSGLAGGVAGMNNVFDTSGFSREQIAALETTVAQQYAKASASINLGVLLSIAMNNQTTPAQWQDEIGKQEGAMTQLRALALTLRIPTTVSK